MKRILVMLAVVALLMAAMAVPAFAASDNANCVGQFASGFNQLGKEFGVPGAGGRLVSVAARAGIVGEAASTNCQF